MRNTVKQFLGTFGILAFCIWAAAAMGANLNTSGRCVSGTSCNVGEATTTSITLTTDGADASLDATADTFLLTATTTNTAIFQGADAAGAADTLLDTTGAGAITVGSADVTSVSIVTDAGTVTIDGSIAGDLYPVGTEMAAGTLTVNTVTIATTAGDYDLPDSCDSATRNWVTLIVRDANEVASLTVLATEDEIRVGGVDAAANEEIDSPGGAAGDGASITVACLTTNNWYSVAQSGVWVDGGAAD